ncbi:MAG: FecR domain-containing protein [Gemmatimonadaceae bacterium]|nr:FecR domain-containing protein [Chitinophagaceae bacterium]
MDFKSAEELLMEETFFQWLERKDKESVSIWEKWISIAPANQAMAEEAVRIYKTLRLTEKAVPAAQVEAALQRFQQNTLISKAAPVIGMRRKAWFSAAAVLIFIIAGAAILSQTGFFSSKIQTQYGQIKLQQLPDGSQVTLNAHSQISFAKTWDDGSDREVWLDGEAFFHVSKTAAKSRFIVHTNRFDIIVTGTQFNAVNRNGKTSVTLKEGSVIVLTKDGRRVAMKPGQFIEVKDDDFLIAPAEIDAIIAWKERKMSFNNTPMREVARLIEEHYGVEVVLQDEATANHTIMGIMANDNLEVLLTALEATSDFTIVRDGNKIVINHQP